MVTISSSGVVVVDPVDRPRVTLLPRLILPAAQVGAQGFGEPTLLLFILGVRLAHRKNPGTGEGYPWRKTDHKGTILRTGGSGAEDAPPYPIASNWSIMPSITPKPCPQKAGSAASRPKGASNSL